jgi:hypothetical protein
VKRREGSYVGVRSVERKNVGLVRTGVWAEVAGQAKKMPGLGCSALRGASSTGGGGGGGTHRLGCYSCVGFS